MTTDYLLKEDGFYLLQENGDQIIINVGAENAATAHLGYTLRLLYGDDKRKPRRAIDLSEFSYPGHIFLSGSGFNPGPGPLDVSWRSNFNTDGEERWRSRRGNAKLSIKYDLRGDHTGELGVIQRQISRFVDENKLKQEDRKGEKAWIEYGWVDSLRNVPAPYFGQWRYYYEIVKADTPQWPNDLHKPSHLVAGNIIGTMLDLVCKPYTQGLKQLAGDADGFADIENDVDLVYPMGDTMAQSFTVAGWQEHIASTYVFFEYYLNGDNFFRLWYDSSVAQIKLTRTESGVLTSDGYSFTGQFGAPLHVMVVNLWAASIIVYINGVARITGAGDFTSVAGGRLKLGGALSNSTTTSYTNDLDCWRVWKDYCFTATQALQLYTNEATLKSEGLFIGPPLYHKTRGGDGDYDSIDGTISATPRDNWGIVANVPGDVEALTEWEIEPSISSVARVYWLGVEAGDEPVIPEECLWLEFGGTADAGSSGDAYESSGAGTSTYIFDFALTPNTIRRGRYQFLGLMRVTSNTVAVQPYYQLGNNTRVVGDSVSVAAAVGFLFRDFGDLDINFEDDVSLTVVKAGLVVTRASSATVDLDFVQMMPFPNFRVEAEQASLTLAGSDKIIVRGRQAWAIDESNGYSPLQKFEFQGDETNVKPGKYNTVIYIPNEEGQGYSQSRTARIRCYVTPRWTLPGGLIA